VTACRSAGRTVLGGLLGGWLAVELHKRVAGIHRPTGDGFACRWRWRSARRLGCRAAGCCAGVSCAASRWAYVDAAGTARVPLQAIEAVFHFAAAVLLAVAARRGWQPGRRLLLYFAAYAAVRFCSSLAPASAGVAGATWHQCLAALLFVLAGGAWMHRAAERESARTTSPTPS